MKEIKKPKQCSLYYPGHNTHWIEAGQSRSNSKDFPAKVIYRGKDVFTVIPDSQESIILHHHDPERLNEALSIYPEDKIRIAIPGLIVKALDEEGDYFFSMSLDTLGNCINL